MAKITNISFKVDLNTKDVPNANKIEASDINEIISVVNLNDDLKTDKGTYKGTAQDLKNAIDNAVFDGAKTYQTESELLAVSPIPANGTPAKVANDTNKLKNGDWSVVSGAWFQNKSIIDNIANSVDIKTVSNQLQFSDRNKTTINEGTDIASLGYKYIRSDFDFTAIPTGYDNSIWEIRESFDLSDAGTITLPENSTLFFNGGKLLNATIVGNNTKIQASLYHIFEDCTLSGTFNLSEISCEWFGAKFDANFRTAGVGWFVDESKTITATDNTIPIQSALDLASSNIRGFIPVILPSGFGVTGVLYLEAGTVLRGKGCIENFTKASTRLVAKTGANQDILRFNGVIDVSNGRDFWFGEVTDIGFLGDETNSSGWAMNFINSDGDPVAVQDTAILRNYVIRNFPSGGVSFPDGALPLFFSDAKILFNNGVGISFQIPLNNPWRFHGVNFTNVSGDGNKDGLFYFKNLDRGGHITIVNMKSEERINTWYGDVNMQENPIVLENCNFTPITICGASHICSTTNTGTGLKKKPGDLIKIIGTKPSISWSGVAIRVRDASGGGTADDPADPDTNIIQGLSIPFRYHTGNYRNGIYTAYANDVITNAPFKSSLSAWDANPFILGNFYFWIDSNNKLRIKNGAPTSSLDGKEVSNDYHSYSDVSLNAIAGVVNVTGKFEGKQVWNSTQNRPVWAVGSTSGDVWIYADGTTSNTPV